MRMRGRSRKDSDFMGYGLREQNTDVVPEI